MTAGIGVLPPSLPWAISMTTRRHTELCMWLQGVCRPLERGHVPGGHWGLDGEHRILISMQSPLRSSHCALLASGLWMGPRGGLGAGVAQAAVSRALKEASLWVSFSACEFKATLGPSPLSGPAWGLEESGSFWLVRRKRLPPRCTRASLFSGEAGRLVSICHLLGSSLAKRSIPLLTERMCVEGEGRRGEARERQARRGELVAEGRAWLSGGSSTCRAWA